MLKHGVSVNKAFKITYCISSNYGDDTNEEKSRYSMALSWNSITCKQKQCVDVMYSVCASYKIESYTCTLC